MKRGMIDKKLQAKIAKMLREGFADKHAFEDDPERPPPAAGAMRGRRIDVAEEEPKKRA
jgi:hypothetical protein